MKLEGEGQLLRIFIGEGDRWHGKPLYEAIVARARAEGLAGTTVLRGMMGFGAKSRIHTAKVLRLSEDLPIVIEIVDVAERIDKFLPQLDGMVEDGLVTLERAQVITYRAGKEGGKEGAGG
jgi:PII-like signaling protein